MPPGCGFSLYSVYYHCFVYLMHSCVPTLKTANTALQSYTLKIVSCCSQLIVFNDFCIDISLYFCYNISMKV